MTTSEYAVGTLGAVTVGASIFLVLQKFLAKPEVIWENLVAHLFGFLGF